MNLDERSINGSMIVVPISEEKMETTNKKSAIKEILNFGEYDTFYKPK